MPRIDPTLVRKLRVTHPFVAQLLPICAGDQASAERELRWMREHAKATVSHSSAGDTNRSLQQYVLRRSRGEPLQYILGSEFFGSLEISCRPGVLIPRQETAVSTTHLASLLSSNKTELPTSLRVLDLCTGTGCIPLLFHHEFYARNLHSVPHARETLLELTGVDISPSAVDLAEQNKAQQVDAISANSPIDDPHLQSLRGMTFLKADVLREEPSLGPNRPLPLTQALLQRRQSHTSNPNQYDILVSNPPYISTADYWRTTSSSVRKYEPKLALVPPLSASNEVHDGDLFYHRLLAIAQEIEARVVLFEVADLDQAKRVAALAAQRHEWSGVEIWRDDPASRSERSADTTFHIKHDYRATTVPICGSGNGRSVLAYRAQGARWLGKSQ